MKFAQTTFVVETKVTKDGAAQPTTVTLTAGEVSDATVLSSLISGQSPRVRLQTNFRQNGIPKEVTMTWEQYITPGRQPKVVVAETPEQIIARAKADPELMKALLSQLTE